MKKAIPQLQGLLLLIPFLLPACADRIETTQTFETTVMVPMKTSALRSVTPRPDPPRGLSKPGKIYVYGKYLFINERKKGIHVVDNSNPASPEILNFINIHGNVDMAVNNQVLYADSYIDLLAFDISDPRNINLLERVEDVFPDLYINFEKGTFMTYKDTVIVRVVDRERGDPAVNDGLGFNSGSPEFSGGQNYGQGGSMARFTLMSKHLYTVSEHELRLFDVSTPAKPQFVDNIHLGWGIETIFPYNHKLFIGSNTGMHIYDAGVPSEPVHLSTYEHFTACDPVVVNDKHAFVTLRSDNFCPRSDNELHVIDIRDILRPKLLAAYPMQNPHGLGIKGSSLFICEGKHGLKSFDISDVLAIDQRQLQHLKKIEAIDLIPASGSLIVTGPEGIYQFDHGDPGKLRQLSLIRAHSGQ